MPKYRKNVAFILRRPPGEILVCERWGVSGAWQFPQGGVKSGESLGEAITREVREELNLEPNSYHIVQNKGPYRYLFPPGIKKKEYDGQEQEYYLADLITPSAKIRFTGKKPEFQALRWLLPNEFQLEWLPPMKREVYKQVFRDFFGIALDDIPLRVSD